MDPHDITSRYQEKVELGDATPTFSNVVFRGSEAAEVIIDRADFRCCRWVDCIFDNVVFRDCDLRGADFSRSQFSKVLFHGCAVYGVDFPKGRIVVEECNWQMFGSEPRVDFLIVTALPEERDSLLSQLSNVKQLPPSKSDCRIYYEAELAHRQTLGDNKTYRIVNVTPLNKGRLQASNAARDAIRRWNPRYVLLVGIAGGFSEQRVQLGDILIADQIVDYELQRITPNGREFRFNVYRANSELLSFAAEHRTNGFLNNIRHGRPLPGLPNRVFGPVATGDKVIAVDDGLAECRSHWRNLIGVEMEAGGVASACEQSLERPGFFMIRCVSDMADSHKINPDVARWRNHCCDVAAAYTIELLKAGPV